jgi:hypothetical protein
MYGSQASHVTSAAVVVGYAGGEAASVHKFDEKELLFLFEQFKLLRQLFACRYDDDGHPK